MHKLYVCHTERPASDISSHNSRLRHQRRADWVIMGEPTVSSGESRQPHQGRADCVIRGDPTGSSWESRQPHQGRADCVIRGEPTGSSWESRTTQSDISKPTEQCVMWREKTSQSGERGDGGAALISATASGTQTLPIYKESS